MWRMWLLVVIKPPTGRCVPYWTALSNLLLTLGCLFMLGCEPVAPTEQPLTRLDGSVVTLAQAQATPYSVVFFLSPECPLCENYSHVIDELRAEVSPDSVAFFGVFPGRYYAKLTIQGFLARYHPDVSVLLDPDYALTHALGASVTPEAFLLDQAGEILYQGPIDNWIPRLGVKRTVITAHYLRDAIRAVQQGQPVPVADQPPVGCLIEGA